MISHREFREEVWKEGTALGIWGYRIRRIDRGLLWPALR